MRKLSFRIQSGFQIIVALLLLQLNPVYSQIELYTNLPQFLNPEFSTSRVKMKAGKDLTLLLNYNMITEKMIFFQKDQVYDLLNQSSVDTIYMNENRFVPNGNAFYEVFPGSHLAFFIQHRGRIMSPPKPAGYGGTSEISSSTYITRIDIGSQVYNMKLENDLRIKYDPLFWVRINDNMVSFVNEKQLLKIFPGKEDSIKQYIKKNRLKFDKREDLVKIWGFCNDLMK
jgi:hypothetical protein